MTWLPYVELDREIRALLAERMERGLTDELELKLAVMIEEQNGSRTPWDGGTNS